MKQIRSVALLLVAIAALAVPTVADAKPAKRFYLSLGDSLAAGVQPDKGGVPQNTSQGFAYQLARKFDDVKLVNYGCGFATTGSFIRGDRICLPTRDPGYRNVSPRTSQLAAAERFLRRHRDRIAFVTIDIGANDVASCGSGNKIDLTCVSKGVTTIRRNMPKIAKRLRKAAGPDVPMAAMTLYDPFLALWLDSSGGQILARLSQDLAKEQVNDAIHDEFGKRHFAIADVASVFKTYALVPTDGDSKDDPPPVAVAEVCRLTWNCTPAPQGPDIHANEKGYGAIARTFKKALRPLLRRHG